MFIPNKIFGIFGLGTWEIILIVFILLLFFGGKKIPELFRGISRVAREFKNAPNENNDEKKIDSKKE